MIGRDRPEAPGDIVRTLTALDIDAVWAGGCQTLIRLHLLSVEQLRELA
jgi:hypothetical protein